MNLILHIIYAAIIAGIAFVFQELTVNETIKFGIVSAIALIFTELVFFPVINFREIKIENKIEKKYV